MWRYVCSSDVMLKSGNSQKIEKILGGSLRERGCCLQVCAQANDTYVFIYVSSLGASGL